MAKQTETALHQLRFPGETDRYREARDDLLRAEMNLRLQEEAVAAQRRTLPLGGVVPVDYTFETWDGTAHAARTVRLSQLFSEGKDALFLRDAALNNETQVIAFITEGREQEWSGFTGRSCDRKQEPGDDAVHGRG